MATVKPDQQVLDQVSGETAVATRQPAAVGQIQGEIPTQLKLPLLEIAYGVGKLSATFSQGDLVLDRKYLLVRRGEPLIVTFVSVSLYWKQYIEASQRGPGVVPKTYDTEAQAIAAGEITQWPPRGQTGPKPTVSPAGFYQLLIRKPEGLACPVFGYVFAGGVWAPARMFLDKKAHRIVIQEVDAQARFALSARKGGLLAGQFTLAIKTTPRPDGKTETLPVISLSGANSDQDVEKLLKDFTGGAVAPRENDPTE